MAGGVRQLLSRLRAAVERVTGHVSWEPPPWVARLRPPPRALLPGETPPPRLTFREQLAPGIAAMRAWVASHARLVTLLAVGAAGGSVLALVVYTEWKNRPQPVLVALTSLPPSATRIEKDAKPDRFRIAFQGSVAKLEDIGKPVKSGVTIDPKIPGEWKWDNDRLLAFTPAEDWAIGQKYSVGLSTEVFPPHVTLATYDLSFRTALFDQQVVSSEFYQDPTNPAVKKVVATVRFTHPVDSALFEKKLSVKMRGEKPGDKPRKIGFTVRYDEWKSEAYIHSQNVEIPTEDSAVDVLIEGGVKAARGGNDADPRVTSVRVPGMFNFFRIGGADTLVVTNEKFEPEQIVTIQTTATAFESEIVKAVKVCLLPTTFPAIEGQPAIKNHSWSDYDLARIGPEVITLCTDAKLTAIPSDREHASVFSFRYESLPGRHILIRIAKGVKSYGGYELAKDWAAVRAVPYVPDELRIMHDGAVLSAKGERTLTVMSRGLDAVRFEVGRVLPDRINHLVSQTQGTFKQPSFGGGGYYYEDEGGYYGGGGSSSFGESDVTERFLDTRPLTRDPKSTKPQYTALDLGQWMSGGKRGLFFVKAQSWNPATNSAGSMSDRRFVLVTDLGVLVKDNSDATHEVFVQSIRDGRAVDGAVVEVLGRNGIPIANATTDATGHASIEALNHFTLEKQPVAWVVRTGDDLSFLPYQPRDRTLDVSRFDVGGVRGQVTAEGMTGFLFSDRGLYRPGDEVRVGLLVKHPEWSRSLAGVPLEVAVRDARGVEVVTRPLSLSAAGLEEIKFKTEETAPTGTWEVAVHLVKDRRRGTLLGSTRVRIEEFLPDRMRITTRFSQERVDGWVKPADLSALVHLENLFGTPAEGRRVNAELTLSPAQPYFSAWKEWSFHDPLKPATSFTEELEEAETDENGDAEIPLGLERIAEATYRASVVATGFELEGGRGVTAAASTLVSPLDHLLGWKSDGDLGYVALDATRALDVIAVDPSLKRVAVSGLTLKRIEVKWVSALMKQPNGTLRYESIRKEVTIDKKPFTLGDKGTRLALDTKKVGDFVVVVEDAKETELLRVGYGVAGRANLTRDLDRNAELAVRLSKGDYSPGEEIELEIRAPYTGAGLITIERDRVYAWEWFHADTNFSTQKIRLPENLEGNGYVSVSFLRAPDSEEIYMSPLSFGVAPFSVSRARRENKIEIESAALTRPGEPYKMKYRTTQPGRIVVYAVDEGILQVAAYQTPDPLSFWFRKRALEVRTLQILDLVLPEFSLSRRLSGTGGDEEAARAAIARNLNPFKRKQEAPVAFWSGVLDSGPEFRELSIDVPDWFNGNVRVMAVAVSAETMGAFTKPVTVRGPYVINPNLPTHVAPGDEVVASVTVANNVEGSGKDAKVTLAVEIKGPLEAIDGAKKEVTVGEMREASVSFRLRAKGDPGAATVKFVASGGGKQAARTIGISVRPATPYMTDVVSGNFNGGSVDVPVPRTILRNYRTLEVAASPLPLALAPGLVKYLEEYPYGCTEQLVSKSFPAVVLRDNPLFAYKGNPERIRTNVDRAIEILRGRQNADGAFGFWAANSYVSDWQTVYAVHFLTEAREAGHPVPPDLLSRGLSYLRQLADGNPQSLPDARTRAYAIYVLTRNGTVTGPQLATLKQRLEAAKMPGWQEDLTALYMASSHAILRQFKQADELSKKLTVTAKVTPDYRYFYDSLARNAQFLYLTSRHFPERTKGIQGKDILEAVRPLLTGDFNTISSAYSLLALDAYVGVVGTHAVRDVVIEELLKDGSTLPIILPKDQLFPKVEFSEQAAKVRFRKDNDHPTFWQVTAAGYDAALPKEKIARKLEIQRELRDEEGTVVSEAKIGDEIFVHLKVRSIDGGGLPYIAVVDLLPGGFEVILENAAASDAEDTSTDRETEEEDGEDYSGEGEYYEGDYEGDGGEAENLAEEHVTEGGADAYWSAPLRQEGTTWATEYVDVREDRVVFFGTVSGDVQEFVYKVRATTRGTFVVPPTFGESMYDRGVRARGLASTFEVK